MRKIIGCMPEKQIEAHNLPRIIFQLMGGPLIQLIDGITTGNIDQIIIAVIVLAVLLLIAFPVHEAAHAITAKWLGDDTAERMGRVTLNPLKHLDPIGTLLFVISGFGWAKPVPVNLYRLNGNPRTSFAIVALAGPISNILLAAIFALIYRLTVASAVESNDISSIISSACAFAVVLNIALAVFNMIPIPPLDGSRLLAALLPEQGQSILDFLERYGFFILIALSVTRVLSAIVGPPINFLFNLFLRS